MLLPAPLLRGETGKTSCVHLGGKLRVYAHMMGMWHINQVVKVHHPVAARLCLNAVCCCVHGLHICLIVF